jgi:RimJ/RimL family protein N-acetyltransferase
MLPDAFQTPRLLINPIAPQHARPIFDAYAQDHAVTRFLTWRPHQNPAETEANIAHCLATPPHAARTYVLLQNHTLLGAFDLRRPAAHRLEFGYVLARPAWGHGLMTEALTEIAAWALAQPDIFRISAVCDTENTASARVMEKSGLHREGLLRRWLVHPNISTEPRDCFIYARTR